MEQKFNYLYEEWLAIEHDLLRERGLWGFDEPDPLAKYKLDFIEGPCRMRRRMVLNEDFYEHYPHRIPQENIVKTLSLLQTFDNIYSDLNSRNENLILLYHLIRNNILIVNLILSIVY